ncbi:DUF3667 domain-containing protein [Chryseobacterium jejuense]|uniref:DUF3667 domain-containing protein n=1 Tax=Chryseobacterium jejuense TaxID=445960 RepID=UPI001AE30504|nr:DUF3667 domain-containing protein [Chryseobacterium jejuense]MBP2617687.1 hypothetical protein [Chryseobacterium jejuense]
MHNTCLNCSEPVTTKYCGNCGQKTSTHRYSLKHFIEHDFIHGVWHVDKGILFTLKELFTRPGNSVREYILGKRVNYFNVITLLLLTATISSLFSHYSGMDYSVLVSDNVKETMNSFQELTTSYFKIFLLLTIPFNSFFSYLWFRKAGFNYSEHIVLNAYKTGGDMIALLIFTLITFLFNNSATLITAYFFAFTIFSLVYGLWFYSQFFSQSGYSKVSLFFRSLMIPVSFIIFQSGVGFIGGIIASFLKT